MREEPSCLHIEAILGGIREAPMKKMWEAALNRAKLFNLHTEAGTQGRDGKRAETKDVHM